MQCDGFRFHHVRVELRWAAHGLAGVVDDEVEPRQLAQELMTERLDAGRVTQIQTEHLQAMAPFCEVRLLRVTRGGVAREAGGDDQLRTGAQQFQAGLIADLDPSTGQQGNASVQVGKFVAFGEIEVCTRRAQLVVEVMQQRVFLLANVAVQQLAGFLRRDFRRSQGGRGQGRREIIRCGEYRLAAQFTDAGLIEHGFGAAHGFGIAFAFAHLGLLAAQLGLRVIDRGDGLVQARAFLAWPRIKHGAVGGDGFKQFEYQVLARSCAGLAGGWGVGGHGVGLALCGD